MGLEVAGFSSAVVGNSPEDSNEDAAAAARSPRPTPCGPWRRGRPRTVAKLTAGSIAAAVPERCYSASPPTPIGKPPVSRTQQHST
jgi:hypothetical protein